MKIKQLGAQPSYQVKLTSLAVQFYTTSDDTKAMTKIDECLYRAEFDWHYTLSQWIVYFLANKFTALLNSKTSMQKEFNILDEDGNEIYSSNNVSLVIKVKNKLPPKPGLKCHFCNLKYCLEEEREQHEEFWQSNKITP